MVKWIVLVVLVLLSVVGLIAFLGSQLPVKHTVSRTLELPETPPQVWEIIAGPPTWRPDVQHYEDLLPVEGHRTWREYGTHGQKVTYEEIESDPPHMLVTRIADPHLPYGGTWTYEILPIGRGSSLTITENGEIYNPIFRFVSRYVQGYGATIDNYMKELQAKMLI
jgi:hypothetical protein